MADRPFEFDVALSFAGEDRAYVHAIAERLREAGVRVFYDEFMTAAMWGEDLYLYFDEVFRKKARYVVAFVSRAYVDKPWTSHERAGAQARSLVENSTVLLPVLLDDSELPGLRPTVGHVDARTTDQTALVNLIIEKLGLSELDHPIVIEIDRVPRTAEEEALLLASRPAGWEYLLFAAVLRRHKLALEPKWRDHEIGYVDARGAALDDVDAIELVSGAFRHAQAIARNVDRILAPEAQVLAFGALGEPGDPERIEHLAVRLMDVYGDFLEWAAGLRGAIVSDRFERALSIASSFVDAPLSQFRAFVDRTVAEIDRLPSLLREDREKPLVITLALTLQVDDRAVFELEQELARLEASFSIPDDPAPPMEGSDDG